MSDSEFEYRGCRVRMTLSESGAEIGSGVYRCSASFQPLAVGQGEGKGEWRRLERDHQSIHLSADSALREARSRLQKRIDQWLAAS